MILMIRPPKTGPVLWETVTSARVVEAFSRLQAERVRKLGLFGRRSGKPWGLESSPLRPIKRLNALLLLAAGDLEPEHAKVEKPGKLAVKPQSDFNLKLAPTSDAATKNKQWEAFVQHTLLAGAKRGRKTEQRAGSAEPARARCRWALECCFAGGVLGVESPESHRKVRQALTAWHKLGNPAAI